MRRLLPAGIPSVLPLAMTLVALTGSAIAYFSSQGQGTASAAVTQLSAPTISAATANAGGTVTLSWSGVTAPGEGTVSYYVTRDGEDAGGNCPTRTAPTTVKTCTDSGVAIGEHTYAVTATWKTWTALSGSKTANVTVGAVTKFVVAGSTTTPTAGGSTNLTITAKDVNSSTVTTYTGSHNLVFSGASSSPGGTAPTVANSSGSNIAFGSSTALTFASGVASVNTTKNGVLKIYRSGAANIVATEGSITTPAPLALTVGPAAASKFVVAAATTTPTAGAVDNLTITAQDTYGNTASGYTGSHSLVFSGASASPAGNNPTVSDSDGDEVAFGANTEVEFNAGVASTVEGKNGAMKLYKSGVVSLKATEGSLTNTALSITVSAGTATKLVVAAATLTPVAAAADILTITAQDAYANPATAYTGSKNLTFSGATASPSGAAPTVANSSGTAISFGSVTAITFTSGVATATSTKNGTLKLNRAGAASVTATDGTISSSALGFTVAAGAASRWALTNAVASAGAIGSPCLFTCAVTSLGNSGTVSANVSVTDSVGNVVSELGSGHAAKVTATGTAGSTIVGTPLEIPATGPATSTTQFTYTAPASGAFSNTLTVAASAGTAYTTATATTSK